MSSCHCAGWDDTSITMIGQETFCEMEKKWRPHTSSCSFILHSWSIYSPSFNACSHLPPGPLKMNSQMDPAWTAQNGFPNGPRLDRKK